MSLSFFTMHLRTATAAAEEFVEQSAKVVVQLTKTDRFLAEQETRIAKFLETGLGGALQAYLELAEALKTGAISAAEFARESKNLEYTLKRFATGERYLDIGALKRRGTSGVSSPASTQQGTTLGTAASQGKLPSSGGLRF